MIPPLALDVDGTLTRPDGDPGLDPRVFEPLHDWPAPVVIATGKAFPYPVALCDFLGIDHRVIAENGGVVCTEEEIHVDEAGDDARALAEAFAERGHDLGWGDVDLVNRWRETEVAVRRTAPEDVLRELAEEYGLAFVDTGYAYHLTAPETAKGRGLERLCAFEDHEPADFVAVGDSENDVSTFAVAGESYAVANADDAAREAADHVTEGAHADGTLAVLERLRA